MAQAIAISDFVKQVNKQYGQNTVVTLGQSDRLPYGENVIPTGSMALDHAIGIGGYPRGRVIEIVGNPMSGKTTLALHAAANESRIGNNILYVDAEHALDVFYAQAIGVDTDKMFIMQPDFGEQALNVVEAAASASVVSLIVVDSVAALVPKRELDGEIGDAQVGLQARMMSQACRKLSGILRRTNTTVIFINQFRANIATTGFGGPSKIATGGKALEYAASIIIDVAKIQSLKTGEDQTGNKTQATVKKNKVSSPYRVAEFDIEFGVGIDRYGEIVDLSERAGLLTRSGAWYKVDGETVAQGRPNMIKFLKENAEYANGLSDAIFEYLSGNSIKHESARQGLEVAA
jgi:recombination protein RecA